MNFMKDKIAQIFLKLHIYWNALTKSKYKSFIIMHLMQI